MEIAVATVAELQARLPFTMDPDEQREAQGALETLSDDARFYGKPTWTTPAQTPPQVVRLVLKAANRHMKNYEGFTTSRAGDETVTWDQQGAEAGSAHFTEREKKQLAQLAGRPALMSVPIQAWGTVRRLHGYKARGMVPTEHGAAFPMFCNDDGPWCDCGSCR